MPRFSTPFIEMRVQENDSLQAGSAFVEQPAAVRALAIPEILERVLQCTNWSDWHRTRRVSQLWQVSFESILLRRCQKITVKAKSRFLYFFLLAGERVDASAILKRRPGLGRNIRYLDLSGPFTLSATVVDTLRNLGGLEKLVVSREAAKQLAHAHVTAPLVFASLREARVSVRPDSPAGEADDCQAVLRFIASQKSLRQLYLRVDGKSESNEEGISKQFAQLFRNLPMLRHLRLELWHCDRLLDLAQILPVDLITLTMYCNRSDTTSALLDALVDVNVLPCLVSFPTISQPRKDRVHLVRLLQTWPKRASLMNTAADVRLLESYKRGLATAASMT